MSEWKETTIFEIITLIGGGTPKTSVSDYWNGDIPWLSVVDFNNGKKFVFDTEKKITRSGLENSSTKLLDKGDIIISARGSVGVVAMLGKQMAFNQSCYGVRANKKSTNDYVYYLLKDRVSNFQQYSHGGVFDTITRDTFKEIDILLPPLPEQRAIASVLSSLDDKIDLLHRQNQTLEQMAETLYDAWFEESEFTSRVSNLIELQNGYAFKSKSFQDFGEDRVLKIKNISGGIVDIETTDFVNHETVENLDEKFSISTGDILFAMTGAKTRAPIRSRRRWPQPAPSAEPASGPITRGDDMRVSDPSRNRRRDVGGRSATGIRDRHRDPRLDVSSRVLVRCRSGAHAPVRTLSSTAPRQPRPR